MLVFNFFAECLNRAPGLINNNVNLVKKVAFPLEILPWMCIGTALFHAAISLLVWMLFALYVYHMLQWTLIFLPLVMLPLVFMTLGICWIISSLGVYIRDIGQLIGVMTSFIMFMSPIFYPIESLPKMVQAILHVNPLTFMIQQARAVMISGQLPDFAMIGIFTLASLVFAWLALAWFQRAREGFSDVL
ncbi:ABC transporter permease [Diaphorobacter aerolatus]|uniref:ABC transporter permease n=1 Tax=Diaphorobacter aerolatus TaxID=1288495 RepID=UPI00384B342A